MIESPRHPWPSSWPPFWRAALHVAIAGGAGNFAAGASIVLAVYGQFGVAWCVALLVGSVPFGAVLSVGLSALLAGTEIRVAWTLAKAFLMGLCFAVIFGVATALLLNASWVDYGGLAERVAGSMGAEYADLGVRLLCVTIIAALVYWQIIRMVWLSTRGLTRRRAMLSWLVGVALTPVAWAWAERAVEPVVKLTRGQMNVPFAQLMSAIFTPVSMFVLFFLTFALTARLLATSGEEDMPGDETTPHVRRISPEQEKLRQKLDEHFGSTKGDHD